MLLLSVVNAEIPPMNILLMPCLKSLSYP